MTGSNRLVLVALDAMEVSWLERRAAGGDLPNLAAFMRESAGFRVRGPWELLHGSVWPTFASGVNPGRHGRYAWLQWLGEEGRYVRASHPALAFEPFWRGLAAAGVRSTVVDVPYVPLVREPAAEQVIGWGTEDEVERESWPPGLLRDIRREFGRHPLGLDTLESLSGQERAAMARELARGVAMRARLLERLAGDPARRFAVVLFGETHKAGHYLAEACEVVPGVTNLDLVARVLRPLDEAWPRVLQAAGEGTTVALFALHGMRHQVDFSELGVQVLALALGKEPAAAVPRADLLRRLRDAIPDRVHRFAWNRLPARVRAARQAQLDGRVSAAGREPVFRVTHDIDLALRLNLAGRERDGSISPAEGEALLARVEAAAAGVRTGAGEPVYRELWRTAEHFSGPRAHRLPDALLVGSPELVRVTEAFDAAGRRLVNPMQERRNGVHTGRGFCYVRPGTGVGLDGRAEIDARDFAPTAYAVLGVPAPPGFEGKPFAGCAAGG
ncbi:alkaline phosphatase family protein [Tepidiforma flava]|uniref:Alkaline phosphatase family protein n=1 Tax=Tepidiforma flava TaxID=3004094 RepID=A0ABY7M355_9CHLR|nr:alkaline phosphatase family protein [Tepidiforma flava]WBL34860.1 alkaline phosphatase family protein [Tepidiforma flava]